MKKSVLTCLMAFLILVSVAAQVQPAALDDADPSVDTSAGEEVREESLPYESYIGKYANEQAGRDTIVLTPSDIVSGEHYDVQPGYAGYADDKGAAKGCVVTYKDSTVTYAFTVNSPGLYRISFDYYPVEGTSNTIKRGLVIDGAYPFSEAEALTFERLWKDASAPSVDKKGNETRPSQIEAPQWTSKTVCDSENFYSEGLSFYLSAGDHTLTVVSKREPMSVGDIRLTPAEPLPTYDEVKEKYTFPVAKNAEDVRLVQAEDAALKSDPMLYAIWDRSSSLTRPMDYFSIKLNTIGGSRWNMPGQWIEWEIEVPEDGLYRIGFRARQNITPGVVSTRKLTIDGAVPFAEAAALEFRYDSKWQSVVLGDGKSDYLFELKKGAHRLRLEVVLGKMGEIIKATDDVLLRLNKAYREIIVITGASPDVYRDYYLDQELPQTIEDLGKISKALSDISERLTELSGKRSQQNRLLDRLAVQTSEMSEKPRTISKRLSSFKSNISSLGTWALSIRQQALELDYIMLMPDGAAPPDGNDSVWSGIIHELKLFFAAFFTDYAKIGSSDNSADAINVWVSSGREQAQIIKQIISRDYTGKKGGEVNLQLVASTTLLPSILSGKGPDVALNISSSNVMDYAARGALLPLTPYLDSEELGRQFYESALVPLQYNGDYYALPEAQVFPVLFYRTDILEELGIGVPSTWQDLYDALHELSKKHMEFGMPASMSSYAILLYQNGGSFYKENGMRSALDEEVSINAFRTFANFYMNYGIPKAYDFANRFRSGEMPIGIADYSMYNQLVVFAPEISGLWSFAPMIGTLQPDGSIDRSTACSVTGAVVLRETEKPEECVNFVRWWTGKDPQLQYAREQESVMGAAARYTVANREAMEEMAWEESQLSVLKEQWKWVKPIPEVPGGYYTSRYVDFAYKAVVLQSQDVRETLLNYAEVINKEIDYKRREFHLKVYGEE